MDKRVIERFRARLGEVIAWLNYQRPFLIGMGVVARTSSLEVAEAFAADHSREAAEQVVVRRASLLARNGVSSRLPAVLPPGRVLLLLVDRNLKDGAAVEPSGSFFDEHNVPPCDTWIDFFSCLPLASGSEDALACWVPEELVELAQRGVDVNPEECLLWAEEVVPGFAGMVLA